MMSCQRRFKLKFSHLKTMKGFETYFDMKWILIYFTAIIWTITLDFISIWTIWNFGVCYLGQLGKITLSLELLCKQAQFCRVCSWELIDSVTPHLLLLTFLITVCSWELIDSVTPHLLLLTFFITVCSWELIDSVTPHLLLLTFLITVKAAPHE